MTRRALTLSLEGARLTAREAALIKAARPFGVILFGRNVETPDQLRALTDAIRDADGRDDPPILIDQEGGRVQRLRKPAFQGSVAAARIGQVAQHDREKGAEAAFWHALRIGLELRRCGVSVNCAPCLDLAFKGASSVIGDRSYGPDPDCVALLGRAAIEGYRAAGVTPIVKHLPGHGRASVDSHVRTPIIDAPAAELRATDFTPFAAAPSGVWGMTGHLVLTEVDPDRPVTHSPTAIAQIIRGDIGLAGPLFSDDISMGALSGDPVSRALSALSAGCDVALHCNGDFEEMTALAEAAPALRADSAARFEAHPQTQPVEDAPNAEEADRRLADLIGEIA